MKNYLLSEEKTIALKIYNLATLLVSIGAALAGVLTFALGGGDWGGVAIFVLASVNGGFLIPANRCRNYELWATISFSIIFAVMLPLVYMKSGGMLSGMPCWFALQYIMVFITLTGIRRVAMLVVATLSMWGCLVVEYFFPALVTRYNPYSWQQSIDIAFAVLCVGFIVGQAIRLQYRFYNETVKQNQQFVATNAQFLGEVAQEMRIPLGNICGVNELAQHSADLDKKEYIATIRNSAALLASVADDVTDMALIGSNSFQLEKEKYRLSELVRESSEYIRTIADEKGLEFEVSISETVPDVVCGDRGRVRQVLVNLLMEAVRMMDYGRIGLFIDCRTSGKDGIDLLFGIRNMTKRFTEGERNAEQSGSVSLELTRRIIEKMQGTIAERGEAGYRTLFYVALPQALTDALPEETALAAVGNEMNFHAPDARILLVDDNELNLRVVDMILKQYDVKTELAFSGEKCLQILRERKDNPQSENGKPYYNLILLDHMMPGLSGMDTFRQIRSEILAENTPVIVLTADKRTNARSRWIEAGFADYIGKPVEEREIRRMLLRFLPGELIRPLDEKKENASLVNIHENNSEKLLSQYLDIEEALKHSDNGMLGVIDNVGYFLEGIDTIREELDTSYHDGKMQDYAIYLKGLQDAAIRIGAMGILGQAKVQEDALEADAAGVLSKRHMRLMVDLVDLESRLRGVLAANNWNVTF